MALVIIKEYRTLTIPEMKNNSFMGSVDSINADEFEFLLLYTSGCKFEDTAWNEFELENYTNYTKDCSATNAVRLCKAYILNLLNQ